MAPPAVAEGWVAPNPFSVEQFQKTPVDKMPPANTTGLTAEETASINVFINNTPSVVNISNLVMARSRYSTDVMTIPQGTGSGFIWDNDGHVVTNYHVIKGASEVKVTLIDQSTYTAVVIGADENKDVAVLKLNLPPGKAAALKRVEIGASATLQVGQKVYAIGNPFGLDHTMTSGIISGVGRELQANEYGIKIKNVIQTDAAVNPGNSGGVLLNSRGQLIGVNTAIVGGNGGAFSGVGFAIPIDMVKGLVDQILTYGKVMRPMLGITLAPPQILDRLQIRGVLVLDVPADSPAGKAGVLPSIRNNRGDLILGDIIVAIDKKAVKDYSDLFDTLDAHKPNETVEVEVLRSTSEGTLKKQSVKVKLAERSDITVSE